MRVKSLTYHAGQCQGCFHLLPASFSPALVCAYVMGRERDRNQPEHSQRAKACQNRLKSAALGCGGGRGIFGVPSGWQPDVCSSSYPRRFWHLVMTSACFQCKYGDNANASGTATWYSYVVQFWEYSVMDGGRAGNKVVRALDARGARE